MILLANGCSHTAGAELERPKQGECYKKAWPSTLAKLLEFDDVLNLAISGASSDRIVRTTIEYFIKESLEPSYNHKNYFVIVNWPGMFRTEIYNKHHGWRDGWQPLVVGNDKQYKKDMDIVSYAYYKAWTVFAKPHPQTINYMHNIMLLQYFLTAHKIKYLFWSASISCPFKEDYLQHYYKQIYYKRYPFIHDPKHSYFNLLKSNGFEFGEHSESHHYGQEAQDWFARFLKRYITNHKLL